jgi:hypothetical protein
MSLAKHLLFAIVLAVSLPACSDDSATGPDAATGDSSGGFACGSGLTCQAGQYCEQTSPGQCGGDPVPDAGTCPTGCDRITCPNSQSYCSCNTRSCKPLPSGCTSCSCFTPPVGCTCQDGAGGSFVSCAMP